MAQPRTPRDKPRASRNKTRGRAPTLTRRGGAVGVGALCLLATGVMADRSDLVVLGAAMVALLLSTIVARYPAAVFVWRRHVELAWRVDRPAGDPALYPGRELMLSIELRNRSPRSLGIATLRPIVSSGLSVEPRRVATQAGTVVSVKVPLIAHGVGVALLHGAAVSLCDRLGLTEIEAYFPSPIALPIVPRLGVPLLPGGAPLSAGPERAQRSAARLAGQDGQLRELRDHRPGDPWKQIAWKASARRGRLMVRELERESQSSHLLVLDVSGAMRQGKPGSTPLDVAIELSARYLRGALDAGDRAGLMTVDGRTVHHVPLSDRPGQRRKLMEALTLAPMAYDENTTDLSDAELCATVGRYLLLQEGSDARVPPPLIDDPAWRSLVTSPAGELYDQSKLLDAMRASRKRHPQLGRVLGITPPLPRAQDPDMAELRGYCRERAIALPPLLAPARGAHGISAALQQLGKGRPPDRIVMFSLLEGIDRDDRAELSALRNTLSELMGKLRRRGARLSIVAPTVFAPAELANDPIDELLALETGRQREALQALSEMLGTPVQAIRDAAHFRVDQMGGQRRRRAA